MAGALYMMHCQAYILLILIAILVTFVDHETNFNNSHAFGWKAVILSDRPYLNLL